MATIFGIIVVGVPILLLVANLGRIIDFVKSVIKWHFD